MINIYQDIILSQKNLILGLKKQFSSYFLLSIAFLEKRIWLAKTRNRRKNLLSILGIILFPGKKILILMVKKHFSSYFLLSIAFLEKRIWLAKTRNRRKNLFEFLGNKMIPRKNFNTESQETLFFHFSTFNCLFRKEN